MGRTACVNWFDFRVYIGALIAAQFIRDDQVIQEMRKHEAWKAQVKTWHFLLLGLRKSSKDWSLNGPPLFFSAIPFYSLLATELSVLGSGYVCQGTRRRVRESFLRKEIHERQTTEVSDDS